MIRLVSLLFRSFSSDPAAFRSRALACVRDWESRISPQQRQEADPDRSDPHYITFSEYSADVHGAALKAAMEVRENA